MLAGEIDRLAPADLHDLIEAWSAQQRRWDARFAVPSLVMAEANRSPTARPFRLSDFFASLEEVEPEMTPEELDAKIMAVFG